MINTFILTEGSNTVGMGHISRCLSLYQAFEAKGHGAKLIVNGDNSINKPLEGTNYLKFDWVNNISEILSIVKNADIIIIDSYYCSFDFYNRISLMCQTAVYIDDNIRFVYPKGVVINGVMGAENFNYPKRDNLTYLLGQDYAFLRKDFWVVPPKIINRKIKSIMITMGGNDSNGLSLKILKSLVESFPNIKKSVVLKNLEAPNIDYYTKYATVYTNLTALNMKNLMRNSDIAISAAGQTTYELCRVGTPFIAVNTAENQTYSISRFYIKGLIPEAIHWMDKNLNIKLLEQFNTLANYNLRKETSKKMQYTITGKGSLNVIEHLLKYSDKQ